MASSLTLEERAVASLVFQSGLDLSAAAAALDASGVRGDHFSSPALQKIWAAVEAQIRDGKQPELFATRRLAGGVPDKLLQLVMWENFSSKPSWWESTPHLLAQVKDGANRRTAKAVFEKLARMCVDESVATDKIRGEADAALRTVLGESATGNVRSLATEVVPVIDHLDAVHRGLREPVLATGIGKLDAVIGGLQPTLTVVGGLPGVGKSALLATIVRNLAKRGVPTGVISLEDEGGWMVRRLLAQAANIPVFVLANRKLGPEQMARATEAQTTISEQARHILVDDRPGLDVHDVVASARQMLQMGAKALFVDHLGEIHTQRSERHDLEIKEVVSTLRGLCKTYRVPVVLFCHLRRRDGLTPADVPLLTDFAFSASIERAARVALGVSKRNNELFVHVLKQTQGQANQAAALVFDSPSGLVLNSTAEETKRAMQNIDKTYGIQDDQPAEGAA